MHSLSTVVEFAVMVLALSGAADGLTVPTANRGHDADDVHLERDGKVIEAVITEAMQVTSTRHNSTIPVNSRSSTITTVNPDARRAVSNTTPKTAEEDNNNDESAHQHLPREELAPFVDHDGANYCVYRRIDNWSFVTARREWKLIAPLVPESEVPSICGGLWDNLKQFGICLDVSDTYCGKWAGTVPGEPGLQWGFQSSQFCHSGLVGSTWWDATGAEEEWFGNVYCIETPWDENHWQDDVDKYPPHREFLEKLERERLEREKEEREKEEKEKQEKEK